jgi:hypothetical protein
VRRSGGGVPLRQRPLRRANQDDAGLPAPHH